MSSLHLLRSRVLRSALVIGLCANAGCADHGTAPHAGASPPEFDAAVAIFSDAGSFGGLASGADAGALSSGASAAPVAVGATDDTPPLGPIQLDSCGDIDMVGLDKSRISALTSGGPAGALRYLYPYDGTVFPRGLAAPVLMWEDDGQPVDAVHLYIHSSTRGFRGCFKPEAPGRLTLPQAAWDALAANTRGKADPFQVELTILRGAQAAGPIRESLIIAPGSLKGSVFYNSYSSALGKKVGAPGGVVLRIPAGGSAEVFVGQRACAGCHGLSADGRRLVTNEAVYALTPGIGVNPPPLRAVAATFPGVSPDGSVYAMYGQLVETDTGATVPLSLPALANQVSFSPDGRWVTFIGGVALSATGGLPSSGFAVMRYDAATRSTSERRDFPNLPASITWPNFLPDDKAIVALDALSNDLLLIDLQRGTASMLARAMGFATPADAQAKKSFLPFGTAEIRSAFYPTVAPVAAGGYFWVYFDSPRRYGNMDTRKIASGLSVPTGIDLGVAVAGGVTASLAVASRQLWVTAVEIAPDGDYSVDRSAPAFYLPGQELGTDNHRAFSALDPCRDTGASCQSGTDCCLGFCNANKCEAAPPRCAKTEEACKTQADCCNANDLCINNFCSAIVLL